jgi:hypothetical protein
LNELRIYWLFGINYDCGVFVDEVDFALTCDQFDWRNYFYAVWFDDQILSGGSLQWGDYFD